MTRGIKKAEVESAIAKLTEARDIIEALAIQMEEYFEERSEAWQEGEGGDAYSEKMQLVEMAQGWTEESIELLEELIEG